MLMPALAPAQEIRIVLPAHIDAKCVSQAADDYRIRSDVLIAMVMVESGGRSVVANNTNQSVDCGVAQQNFGGDGWGNHLYSKYGLTCQDMVKNPCQSIRAQAYILRKELDGPCVGKDIFCAIARYHSPGNKEFQNRYISRVIDALDRLHRTGRMNASSGSSTPVASPTQSSQNEPSVASAPFRRIVSPE